jgi:UDP-glucose 4-epimerase
MTILVTGSSGHLGEALVRTLRGQSRAVRGVDIKPSPFTDIVGSIADRNILLSAMDEVSAVLHTATLHKPHIATHSPHDFVNTNITGTLNLLEAAAGAGVKSFIYTSTTSVFGDALSPPRGAPAAWISEDVVPIPKNIYGATKLAAEHLCQITARNHRLPVLILRTSRFFPEDDDNAAVRSRYSITNMQAMELLYRRADIADVVSAHLAALDRAPALGFGMFIISATTAFTRDDLPRLNSDAPAVLMEKFPDCAALFDAAGWSVLPAIDRVYVNDHARRTLGWVPHHDFTHVLHCLRRGDEFRSALALEIGAKGYHDQPFPDGPYPV